MTFLEKVSKNSTIEKDFLFSKKSVKMARCLNLFSKKETFYFLKQKN